MDSLELLNVLDVIKNEEVYTKRLSKLKEIEESTRNLKYVDVTMVQADKIREEALALKAQAEENLRCIEEEVNDRVRVERDYLFKLREKLDLESERLEKLRVELSTLRDQVEDKKKSVDTHEQTLKKWMQDITAKEQEVTKREVLVNKKCSLIRNAYELKE